MPTYEYRCDACTNEFEIVQRITDDRLKKCPKCKKLKLTRLVGTGNFILKGGGWYADGYSSKKPSTKPDGDSGGKSTESKKPEAKKTGSDDSAPKKTETKKTESKSSS